MPDVVNKPIPDDDPRVAAVGTLWADGRLISHATVLAPGVAVAPSFGAAQADLLKIGRRGGPTRYRVLQVNARTPFAVLTYSDHGNGVRLGGGRMAAGATLAFVAYDEKGDQYFCIEGQVATTPNLAIFLKPGFEIPPSWTGTPAFDKDGLLNGMTGRGAGGPILLDVLPLDEMLASCKELAGLLVPERVEQVRISEEIAQAERDDEIWALLRPSARSALARAEGIRRALGKEQIHTEYLIAGLLPSWKSFFARSGVDEEKLREIVARLFGDTIPGAVRAPQLDSLPPLSTNTHEALVQAAKYADERHANGIWSTHLLYGALSVERSKTVQALNEHGIRREDIRPGDGPDKEDSLDKESDLEIPAPIPPLQDLIGRQPSNFPGYSSLADAPGAEASPAPSVESDLWSEIDRLGYEAYARTIAKLITHRETKPPLTIGIKAPWGAGKTTLMKRVQHLLDGRAYFSEENRSGARQQGQAPQMTLWELLRELKRSTKSEQKGLSTGETQKLPSNSNTEGAAYGLPPRVTVWFNAWKYQTSEQIWAGMAHCIISQVTARMLPKERELFWLRLHARRIKADEVRWRVYETIMKSVSPYLVVFVILLLISVVLPINWYYRAGMAILPLIPGAVEALRKLGDKAAGTVRELVREPDYEGKMGYLHLVESDIREVLSLVTAPRAGVAATDNGNEVTSKSPPSRTEREKDGALTVAASSKSQKLEAQRVEPLIVFVDDLDRCAPNKVAEVVEAINLFLCGDYPNCIFVLGMEPGMVAAALEVANKDVIEKAETMGLVDRAVPVGWRFMEKIVQLPIMIPPPTAMGRQRYVDSLTGVAAKYEMQIALGAPDPNAPAPASPGAMGMSPGIMRVLTPRPPHGAEEEKKVQSYLEKLGPAKSANEAAKKGVEVVAQAPAAERWAAEEAGNRLYEQALTEHDPVMAKMVEEVARLVDGNPRQIKRYVNVFRFYSTLRQSLRLQGVIPSDDLPKDKVLAKFVALSIQWPHAVDCLRVKKELSGDDADGKKVSLLHLLETESRKMTGDGATADCDWVKLVGKEGLGMGPWAERRSFREFLARGESLCEKEGHGLW